MSKRKNKKFSRFILPSIIIFFSTILFITLPVLLNYNSIQNVIEKKVATDFKINLKILGDISFKIFPGPHYLVEKANLDLNTQNDNSSIIETVDLKIFIPLKKIYSKSKIQINKIEIENANIYFQMKDILDLRKHLYYKINKPIYIKKSNFFLIDQNKQTILISQLKKIKYLIDIKNNSKQFKIDGNIFDVDYFSFWKRSYDNPNKTLNEINIKNPHLDIKNLFLLEDAKKFSGKSIINFLNEKIIINYKFQDNKILVDSPSENQNIKFVSKIELDPFYFESKINFDNKDINFFIDYLFSYFFNSEEKYLGNMNGNVSLEISNLKNSLINNGVINFSIEDKLVKLKKSKFEVQDVGNIESKFWYYVNNGDLIFISENMFELKNRKEFSRKFQVSPKLLKNVNKIYFNLEKNIDNGEISISQVYINKIDKEKFSEKIFIIKNVQLFKAFIRDILS